MDEHAEKNAALAKALGWHGVEYQETWRDDPEGGFHFFDVLRGVSPDGRYEWLPDFYGSVDACLAVLPDEFDVNFETDNTSGELWHYVWLEGQWRGNGATRAEALAAAVLAWAQARTLHGDDGRGT